MNTNVQTELKAVNSLLASIGDTPINSLDIVHPDVDIARSIIESNSLALQSEDWYFNTEHWEFNLDTSGMQPLPSNALYVNTPNPNWVKRGMYIYNMSNHTYIFSSEDVDGLSYSVTSYLALPDLPYLAYSLIVNRSKVQFITELAVDRTKIEVLSKLITHQYIQLQKLNLKFIEPNALQSPTAVKLLLGTPYYSNARRY